MSITIIQKTTVDYILLIKETKIEELKMADESDQNDLLIEPNVYMCAEKLENED